jgi:hypothetical protein
VREALDETAQIGWSFSTGFATAPAARRRAFGGLWFGVRFFLSFWTVLSEPGETLATSRFRVLESRDVSRETLSGAVLSVDFRRRCTSVESGVAPTAQT